MFENSCELGEITEYWRFANVTAVHNDSNNDPNNYRPVSLISICCKDL